MLDLLDVSSIESGKINIIHQDFPLKKHLEALKVLNETKAKEKGVVLEFVVDARLPDIVRGDSVRIQQIMQVKKLWF